jgi:hypothetical protein
MCGRIDLQRDDFSLDRLPVLDTGRGFFSALIGTRKPSPVSSTGRRVCLTDSRLQLLAEFILSACKAVEGRE